MKILPSLFISIALFQAINIQARDNYSDDSLRHMAAKMLMVGFKGDSITPDNPVNGYLTDLGVGGISANSWATAHGTWCGASRCPVTNSPTGRFMPPSTASKRRR